MNEVHRIAKPYGEVIIIAPHFSSDNIFTDPTIKFFLGFRSMDYFLDTPNTLSNNYGYVFEKKYILLYRRIFFFKSDLQCRIDKVLSILFRPIEFFANRFPRFYEKYLSFILRANEIKFILKVKK